MRKILIILFFWLGIFLCADAQQPPQYLHFFTNPYLYNPAFAGYDKSPVIYATHRRQWLGIEGAPVTSNLSFHTPLGNKSPIAMGVNITNDVYGLINNSSARVTFAYMVPLAVEAEHYIKFGISAGAGINSIDLSEVDITGDAALLNASGSNMYLDGRFGLQYHLMGLNIGFTLPQLFATPLAVSDEFSPLQIGRLSRYIISGSYRIPLGAGGGLAFEPSVLYHVSNEAENRIDAIGILHIKEAVWVGGAYQQQSGIGALLGVHVKKLKIGYAYGMGGSDIANYGSGTHEVQIGFTLGKKQEVLRRKPRLAQSTASDYEPVIDDKKVKEVEKAEKKAEKEQKAQEKNQSQPDAGPDINQGVILIESDEKAPAEKDTFEPIENGFDTPAREPIQPEQTPGVEPSQNETINRDNAPANDPVIENKQPSSQGTQNQGFIDISDEKDVTLTKPAPAQTTPPETLAKPTVRVTKKRESTHPLEMQAGKYAVVGTFSQRPNAERMAQKLSGEGFMAGVGFNSEKGYYYVYLSASDSLDHLKDEVQRLRQYGSFSDAWILVVE